MCIFKRVKNISNNGRRYKKRARTATHRRRRSFDTYMAKKKNPYNNHDQREFIVGSGVYVIILYPFSKNNKLMIGKKKPTNRQLTWYKG